MNHIELHNQMSAMLKKLQNGQVKPQLAKEFFNGCGKILNNCSNELIAISMGAKVDIPLFEIKADDTVKLIGHTQISTDSHP